MPSPKTSSIRTNSELQENTAARAATHALLGPRMGVAKTIHLPPQGLDPPQRAHPALRGKWRTKKRRAFEPRIFRHHQVWGLQRRRRIQILGAAVARDGPSSKKSRVSPGIPQQVHLFFCREMQIHKPYHPTLLLVRWRRKRRLST